MKAEASSKHDKDNTLDHSFPGDRANCNAVCSASHRAKFRRKIK